MRKKRLSNLALILSFMLILSACQATGDRSSKEWRRIKESSENSTVHFYTWTKDQEYINFLNDVVAPDLMEQYKIKLKIETDDKEKLLASLTNDKNNKQEVGAVDLLMLSDEAEYQEFSQGDLLYTNFIYDLEDLPLYFSAKDLNLSYFGKTKTKQDVLPFNRQLLTFYYDQDVIYDPPLDLESFKDFLKKNTGSFTYPVPTDAVGGAFVRSIILNFVDVEPFVEKDLSKSEVRELIKPGIEYLKSLKPYLYAKGEEYPESIEELSKLYANKEVVFMMSLDYRHSNKMTGSSIYTLGTRPFILGNSSVGPIEYMAIPFNSDNKAGAMILMNYLETLDVQLSKLKDKNYYGLPAYTESILSDVDKKEIGKALRKKDIVKIAELLQVGKHDIPSKYHQIIVDYWQEELAKE